MSDEPMRVLVVDDDETFRQLLAGRLQRKGASVVAAASAESALDTFSRQAFDVALLDLIMPGMDGIELLQELRRRDGGLQAIVLTGHGSIPNAIKALKLGAHNYLTKPCRLSEVEAALEKAFEQAKLARENARLKEALQHVLSSPTILGESRQIKEVRELIARIAPSSANVLIEGESGTGKELAARAIHLGSPRAEKPFVVVHCAALPEALLESELFGFEKGAFTGAVRAKQGLFEVADKGTLFVDEIGEMSRGVQAKLLRALELGEFRRLGATRQTRADVRIVAATNQDLSQETSAGHFRQDLYYRIHVMTIYMPPLREHVEDIPLLVAYFLKLRRSPSGEQKEISPEALKMLKHYHWPGNVRELANVLERAVLLSRGHTIEPTDLALALGEPLSNSAPLRLSEVERRHVLKVLGDTGFNKARAARILGIHRTELYRLMDKHHIPSPAATQGALPHRHNR